MSETAQISSRVPRTAAWLGVLGVVPFAAGSFVLVLDTHGHSLVTSYLLIAYGAIILSFLGAVHWGLAAASHSAHRSPRWFVLGVIPALAGWGALMLPAPAALSLLIAAFSAVFLVDWMAVTAGLAPGWYLRLRAPLSAAGIAFLALALAAEWGPS